ncbi:MAG TPA: glutathione synthase [Steroidobacteraceae bacterium]|nr:glutathione synthase [Steroidobacteraceae bacterium]
MPKALSLAVVMDPIAKIKFAKDSTLAMLLAAAARGWKLTYFEQSDLFLRDGVAYGRGRPLEVYDDSRRWFELGESAVFKLGEFDCVFMRKDPPFDAEYIYTTYILERAELQGAFVANKPQGLRDMNEKVFTAWFPQCCAPTLITRSAADIIAFAAEHGRIVVKPLHGMGGKSIFVTEQGDKNLPVIIETLTDYGQRFAIAQRYLPEIAVTGDSRVLIIDGQPVPYALARIPLPTDNRGNLAAGAKGVGRELNERDRWLAAEIGPSLAAKGMVLVGIDVIGGFVTEINVTSPTGIREIDQQFGLNIGAMVIEAFERRIGASRK